MVDRAQQITQALNPVFDDTGFERGTILPFRRNVETGEMQFAVPGMIASPLNAMQRVIGATRSNQQASADDIVEALGLVGGGGMVFGRAPTGSVGSFLGVRPSPESARALQKSVDDVYKRIYTYQSPLADIKFDYRAPGAQEKLREIIASIGQPRERNAIDSANDIFANFKARSEADALSRVAEEYLLRGSPVGKANYELSVMGGPSNESWAGRLRKFTDMSENERINWLDKQLPRIAERRENRLNKIADELNSIQRLLVRSSGPNQFESVRAIQDLGALQRASAANQYYQFLLRQGDNFKELPEIVRGSEISQSLSGRRPMSTPEEFAQSIGSIFLPR